MKENSFIKYLLPVIFLVLISLPGILKIAGFKEFDRKDENRRFKDELKFDVARLDYFPAAADSFTKDNFFFRAPLLDFFHRMKFFAFEVSPHPEQSIIGKDGWYFIAGKELDIIQGKLDYSPIVMDSFANEWKERTDYFKALKIPVFLIMAPFKHHVYTEKLPYNIYQSKTNRTKELANYLESKFPGLIIDPLEVLKANKDKEQLYFRLDNHWNTRAGYHTTKLILEKLRATFPDKNIIDIPSFKWEGGMIRNGIHYRVMGIDELEEYADNPVFKNPKAAEAEKFKFKGVPGFAYPDEFEKHYVNESLKNGLRVLFIRDSYAEAVIPFAREVFKESVFIFDAWQYKINKEIVESYKPDVVIFLGLETQIDHYILKYD
jgi:alginate O-acetyltransferase complex protein AlgJ